MATLAIWVPTWENRDLRQLLWHRHRTEAAALAALADQRLRATSAQLRDALGACTELSPVYRRLVKMALEELQLIEQQIAQLDQEIASLLRQHQDAVQRLAEVPGLGGGFGATDHCRGGGQGGDLRFSQESFLVGGGMERKRARE
jgi:hypothetical protein